MWGTESCDIVFECTSLITNSFTISSGGRSPAERRAESRARGVVRRVNMAPLRLNYDAPCITPEKENNMSSIEDISFYSGNSPQASPRPCSVSPCMDIGLLSPETSPQRFTVVQENHQTIVKHHHMDEHDGSSMDSGYSASCGLDSSHENKKCFKFVAPCSAAPRRLDIINSPKTSSSARTSPKQQFRIFNSLSSGSIGSEQMEDEYLDLFEMEGLDDDDTPLPSNLNNLISGNIMATRTTPETKRPLVRRCLSLNENDTNRIKSPRTPDILKSIQENITPYSSRVDGNNRCFKRPEPPTENAVQSKRYRCSLDEMEKENNDIIVPRIPLRKSISLNDAVIMDALAKSSLDDDLIGDFSKPYSLPLLDNGRHRDLKSISVDTMAKLLCGEFSDRINTYKVIDCRYPYEFDGGHIRGAENLYTQEQILEELVNTKNHLTASVESDTPKRNILIFHCEFSSERGPKLSRFLRSYDRTQNGNKYPALHYPEIYLLNGGYKDFYESYAQLCDPISYLPMLHPSFTDKYKHFRAKSKSWAGDIKSTVTSTNRLRKSRSRLVM